MKPPSTEPLVGTKTTPNPKNLDKIVIKDISGLVNTLKEMAASHEDASLSFAVKEQLEVVANIHSPELASYSIDNIIEFLRQNLDVCSPEKISANQNQAALMIQSIFFFNQARIKAMQEESTEVAMDILEHGATTLCLTAGGIFSDYSKGVVFDKASLIASLAKSLFGAIEKNPGLLKKIRIGIDKRRKTRRMEYDLDRLRERFLQKGLEYQDFFGDSVVFKELVKDSYQEPAKLDKDALLHLPSFIFLVVAIGLAVLMLVGLTPHPILYGVGFGLMSLVVLLKVFQWVYAKVAWDKAAKTREACLQQREAITNGRISYQEYRKYQERHDQAVERYYGLDDLYTRIALTSVLLAFWVIGGTGTVALWITPAQLWAEVFLKIASITCFVIILIITIFIYLKYRFVD